MTRADREILRNERIPGCVAKDPKEDQQHQPRPHVCRRDEQATIWFAGDRALRESEESVNDEGQRQHHQRVQLESSDRMQMQQLVKSTRRAAARALATSQQTKRALRKKLI